MQIITHSIHQINLNTNKQSLPYQPFSKLINSLKSKKIHNLLSKRHFAKKNKNKS